MKAENREGAFDPFGRWLCERGIVLSDLDAIGAGSPVVFGPGRWARAEATRKGEVDDAPRLLLEIKRSSMPVESWEPFAEDRPSYALLLECARRIGIPMWILYYPRCGGEEPPESVKLYALAQARPAFVFDHESPKILTLDRLSAVLSGVCDKPGRIPPGDGV